MRITDEWNHDGYKVTVFHMNNRYSIKLEKDLLEQTYKFREGQIKNSNHLKTLLNNEFYEEVTMGFKKMMDSRAQLLRSDNQDEPQFPSII